VAGAYGRGIGSGERASFAVRDALFERSQDVSDPVVLAGIADRLGVGMPDDADRQAVLDDWHTGQQRGVLGSPHFFAGDANVFCPSLTIDKNPDGSLTIAADRRRLDMFLQGCLGT
jgi:2-hydroxychromene-2-carboxylate isomerase